MKKLLIFVIMLFLVSITFAAIEIKGSSTGVICGYRDGVEIFKFSSNWADRTWFRSDQMDGSTEVALGYPKAVSATETIYAGTIGMYVDFEHKVTVLEDKAKINASWTLYEALQLRAIECTVDLFTETYAHKDIVAYFDDGTTKTVNVGDAGTYWGSDNDIWGGQLGKIVVDPGENQLVLTFTKPFSTTIVDLRQWGPSFIRIAFNIYWNNADISELPTLEAGKTFEFSVEIAY